MEAVAVTRKVVVLGVLVAPSLCLPREISTFWEDEELHGILDGIEVIESATELWPVLLPASVDKDVVAHLHALA